MKVSKKVKLSIIIVYFGESNSLVKLLDSIAKNKINVSYQILIVNNKVGDLKLSKLIKKSKHIKIIESGSDLGYGAGNNLGVKNSSGKYVFVINPDTKITKGKIDDLIIFLESHPRTAIIAPNLADTKGIIFEKQGTRILTPMRAIFSLTFLSKILPNNPYVRDYYMFDIPKQIFRKVDVVPGTAFLIRRDIFDKVGGFDEKYFLYFEETDLCKRIVESGFSIYMDSHTVFEHDWKEGERTPDSKYFKKSRFYYFKKHYGLIDAWAVEFFSEITKTKLLLTAMVTLLIGALVMISRI